MFEQHSDLTQNVRFRQKEDVKHMVQQGKQDAALDLHLKESVQLFYTPNPTLYRYRNNYKQVAPDGSLLVPSSSNNVEPNKRRSFSGEQTLTLPTLNATTPIADEKKPETANKLFGLLKKKVGSTPASPAQGTNTTTTTTTSSPLSPLNLNNTPAATTDATTTAPAQTPRKNSLFNKLTNRARGKSLRTLFVKTSKDSPKDADEEEKDDDEDCEVKQELIQKFQKASEELDEVWQKFNFLLSSTSIVKQHYKREKRSIPTHLQNWNQQRVCWAFCNPILNGNQQILPCVIVDVCHTHTPNLSVSMLILRD